MLWKWAWHSVSMAPPKEQLQHRVSAIKAHIRFTKKSLSSLVSIQNVNRFGFSVHFWDTVYFSTPRLTVYMQLSVHVYGFKWKLHRKEQTFCFFECCQSPTLLQRKQCSVPVQQYPQFQLQLVSARG